MLRAFLIAPDEELRLAVERMAGNQGPLVLVKTMSQLPELEDLLPHIRAHQPQVVLFDVSCPRMVALAARLVREVPGVYPVALDRRRDPDLLEELMRAGVRDCLYPPFGEGAFAESMARLERAVRAMPVSEPREGKVLAFLPAQAGMGASTAVWNAAVLAARQIEGRVLLLDADLYCGVTRFLFKLVNPYSILDALRATGEIAPASWAEWTTQIGNLEVMASGSATPQPLIQPGAARRLLAYVRPRYAMTLIDLSGQADRLSVDFLLEAERILLFVRPDLTAVYLAREKMRLLRSLDLDDRVELVPSCWRRESAFSLTDLESVLGIPAAHFLPEDPDPVYRALLNGEGVDPQSDLGIELERLAGCLIDSPAANERYAGRRRMTEIMAWLEQ